MASADRSSLYTKLECRQCGYTGYAYLVIETREKIDTETSQSVQSLWKEDLICRVCGATIQTRTLWDTKS